MKALSVLLLSFLFLFICSFPLNAEGDDPQVDNFLFLFGQIEIPDNTTITHSLTAIGTIWKWDDENKYYPITELSELRSASVSITESTTSEPYDDTWKGFIFDWEEAGYENTDSIAYGFYKVTNSYNNIYFYIDIRDCAYDSYDISYGHYAPDFFIRFDDDYDVFEWKAPGESWISISTGEILNVWDMKNNGTTPNTSFQNYWNHALLVLTDGNNPRLVWGPHPTFQATSYIIYRAASLTPLAHPEVYASIIATVGSSTYEYVDNDILLSSNGEYLYYFVKAYNGSYSGASNVRLVRGVFYKENIYSNENTRIKFSLNQNYPNPFNPTTKIKYQIPEDGFVTLKVYDIIGKEITTLIKEQKTAGEYEVKFDATDLAGGVYIYRITALKDDKILFNQAKEMILLK